MRKELPSQGHESSVAQNEHFVKPLLVMIHGLRGTHDGLADLKRELSEDFEVRTPDLPGYGYEPELTNKSLDGYAEWLHGYCADLPEKPFVVGHSMGSIIVSHYVEKYPRDVQDDVVLLSPIVRTQGGDMSGKMLYYLLQGALVPIPARLKKKILASKSISYIVSHYLAYDKNKQKQIDELHYKYGGEFASGASLLADARIAMFDQAVVPKDKNVALVVGKYDKLAKPELVQVMGQEAGATYYEVDEVGHLLNYEKPAETAELIRRFLYK